MPPRRRSPLIEDEHNIHMFFVEKDSAGLTWRVFFKEAAVDPDLIVHWRHLFTFESRQLHNYRLFEDALQAAAWTEPLTAEEEEDLRRRFPGLPVRPRFNLDRLAQRWETAEEALVEDLDEGGAVADPVDEPDEAAPERRSVSRTRKISI